MSIEMFSNISSAEIDEARAILKRTREMPVEEFTGFNAADSTLLFRYAMKAVLTKFERSWDKVINVLTNHAPLGDVFDSDETASAKCFTCDSPWPCPIFQKWSTDNVMILFMDDSQYQKIDDLLRGHFDV